MKAAFPSVFITGVLAALVLPNALAFSIPTSPRRSTRLDAHSAHFLAANRSNSGFLPTESPYYVKDKQCGITSQVTSASDKNEICPPECPYYAQNLFDDLHCSFACVESSMCSEMNDRRPIADVVDGRKICRGPRVEHCNKFNYDGTDTCAKCQTFYALHDDGLCYFSHWMGLICVIALATCGALFAIVWIVDLILRPVSNEENLRQGLDFRSRQKLHTPKDHEGGRQLWPLDTNLCTTEVAGPGMLLHFNFQVFIMIWAFCVATLWTVMALLVDNALFVLGTRRFGTPRDNCILVAWGYETQQRLMWTKIWFLIIVYIGSFLFCILHGVRQLRLFQMLDTKVKTMKDFVCFVKGMPQIPGSDADIEERVTKCISDYIQQDVVGVSLCWDWQHQEETCVQALEQDLRDREMQDLEAKERKAGHGGERRDKKDPDDVEAELVATYGPLRRWFHNMEKKVAEEEEDDDRPDMKEILEDMKTTTNAFVVFHTEEDRDAAVNKFNEEGGLVFEGSKLELEYKECEPETVYWINFGHSTFLSRMRRLFQGFGAILLALLFWTLVFYAPYAWSVMSFNYDNGAEPPFIFAMTFTMVVVLGNAIMYEVCARVSDYVGFKFKGDRESCYMILYTVACMFNVFLDMVTTYYMAWEIMKGLGFRTYHGEKLEDVTNPQERFESYAMQRILAENTFTYSFPSTFLIPFLLEPFITIYFPLKAGQLLVSRHPKIVGWQAEGWLVAAPMEMGRYADILLNCVLGILIFFFPGGYTHTLFYAMVFSHMIIYAFDHWRVLNTIPQCVFAMMDVDWWSQAMLAPCVSTILSCLVFKANCNGYGYCITGWWPLVASCAYAWLAHLIFHLLVLRYVVPLFGHPDCTTVGPAKDKVFKDVAEETACSWFTSNPIHCLRSKVIHNHSPHCMYWVSGKEHLQEENPSINCFFHDQEAAAEDYSKTDLGFKKFANSISSSFYATSAEKTDKEDEQDKDGKEDAEEEPEKKQVHPPEDDDK